MPKARAHWGYDLLTLVLVALVGAVVFWIVPADASGVASDQHASCHRSAPP